MLDKIKAILLSIRFWQITLVAILQVLALYELVPADLTNVVSAWLAVTVTIGTIDRAAESIGKRK